MSLVLQNRRKTQSMIRSAELRAKQAGGGLIGTGGTDTLFQGDFRRTAKQKEFFSQFQGWVYACTDLIARRIAGQNIRVGEIEDSEAQKNIFLALKEGRKFHEGEINLIPNHPLLDHFHNPNPAQSKFTFLYSWVINLLLSGEGYIVKEGEGEDIKSWTIPTSWITPLHEKGMFSAFKLSFDSFTEAKRLEPENVARWYLPHPTSLKNAYSPLEAIIRPVRIDDNIQESQEQMFSRGMFPQVAISIGQTVGADGKPSGRRPRLTGVQRRQLIGAVLEIWRNSVGQGDPAILDGLIDKIEKLDRSPREMDWEKSGEIVKKRITQIYRVNPIVLGEITGVNRAQAAVAERLLCSNALNPLISTASEALTEFYSGMYESNKKLAVWIDPATPVDPELRDKRLNEARKRNDISKNEWRSEYGFPPEDEQIERSPLASTVGGMTGSANILTQVGQGLIAPDAASQLLQFFFPEMEPEKADLISGVGGNPQPIMDQVDERLAGFMGSVKGLIESRDK